MKKRNLLKENMGLFGIVGIQAVGSPFKKQITEESGERTELKIVYIEEASGLYRTTVHKNGKLLLNVILSDSMPNDLKIMNSLFDKLVDRIKKMGNK